MNSKHMLVVQQFSQTQNETHTFQTVAFGKSLQKPPKKQSRNPNSGSSNPVEVFTWLTMRPSPLPMSTREPLLCCNIFTTFSICFEVAGTNGKQTFRSAGVINGVATAYTVTSAPPMIPVNKNPQLLFFKLSDSKLVGRTWWPDCLSSSGVSRYEPLLKESRNTEHTLER